MMGSGDIETLEIILLILLVVFIFVLPGYVFWQFTTGAYSFELAVVALLTIICYYAAVPGGDE